MTGRRRREDDCALRLGNAEHKERRVVSLSRPDVMGLEERTI